MTIRVYQYHCERPTEGLTLVLDQIAAAHRYRNDHVAIERGRRAAVRARLEAMPSVQGALAALQGATRSTRRAAREALATALRTALACPPAMRALCSLLEQTILADTPTDRLPHAVALVRIDRLAAELRRGARKLTLAHWGTYQSVEASADQVRKDVPLYDERGQPSDPRFARADRRGHSGQMSVHVQNRVLTREMVLACDDSWIRLALRGPRDPATRRGAYQYGDLRLRAGSDGRQPLWTTIPIQIHRPMPAGCKVLWARLSRRWEGPWERLTCEITVEMPEGWAGPPRTLSPDRHGAVALLIEWVEEEDGSVRVGRWQDDVGDTGELRLTADLVHWLRKHEALRSVRDLHLNAMRPKLAELLQAHCHVHANAPAWLRDASASMRLWRSPRRFHDLLATWRRARYDDARDAYDLLDTWAIGYVRGDLRVGYMPGRHRSDWHGDAHLYEYETGARSGALGARLDYYRVLAARWSERYETLLVQDRHLSYEARKPNEPGVAEQSIRQLAGVHELVAIVRTRTGRAVRYQLTGALGQAFGAQFWVAPRATAEVDDEGDAIEVTPDDLLALWREQGTPSAIAGEDEPKRGAWSRRKAAKRRRVIADSLQDVSVSRPEKKEAV
jgi:hypothetical protein